MRRVVIGSRNRVMATDNTRFVSGASLITDFAAHEQHIQAADALIWAWYAVDNQGKPDISATLRGTETILNRLAAHRIRGIFLSTDAVFSGREGRYTETDTPDPQTDYARIKHVQEGLMTDFARLRFTTFGPSYSATRPLLIEMIEQTAVTVDRPQQYFSPISTTSLNRVVEAIATGGLDAGVYHLTSERISKAACCELLAKAIGVVLPPRRREEAHLDLSLTSRTHNFALSSEVSLAAAAWERFGRAHATDGGNPLRH